MRGTHSIPATKKQALETHLWVTENSPEHLYSKPSENTTVTLGRGTDEAETAQSAIWEVLLKQTVN